MNLIIVKSFKIINITLNARKMSTDCFKGVPLEKIYRGPDQWHLNHLPPIQNKRDHIVLFELPIAQNSKTPPKPLRSEVKWDSYHVKLPCSPQNEYKTESASDPTKAVKTTRWEVIQTALLRDFHSSRELAQAILAYNPKYAKEWKFKTLHTLFETELEDHEARTFFSKMLPDIIGLALQLPDILPSSIPLLKRNQNKSVSLSQQQIACLLANAFLCTFPRRNESSRNAEYSSYPSINFSSLFQTGGDQNIEKLKCICNYFRRVCSKMPTGVVTFTRRSVHPRQLPEWDECDMTFADSMLHVSDEGTIEDEGEGLLQVDFANKFLGGGVLNYGCVQEEIRFMICPELLVSRLFTEVLSDNECLLMMGCERFNYYSGYASTFQWTGDYLDTTPFDSSRRRKCTIVAIDAVLFRNKSAQYKEDMLQRELNKAYIGFKHDLDSPAPGVATGNWGCGAFNGNKHLKSLIQLIACCVSNRPLVYYTFGDEKLRDELFMIYEYLTKNKVKIGELWSCLLEYAEQKNSNTHLFEFIIACHQGLKEHKPSTNGQCSKQANRSDEKSLPKPKPRSKPYPNLTSKPELKPAESDNELNELMNDIEPKQFHIEDDSDDEQFSANEALEMLNKSKLPKPYLTRTGLVCPKITERRADHSISTEKQSPQTIQQFFASPNRNDKKDNQDKRPRSLLVECLDKTYDQTSNISPIKIKRTSITSNQTISDPNTSVDLDSETKDVSMVGSDKAVDEIGINDESVYDTCADDESNCEEKESENCDQLFTDAMSEDMFDDVDNEMECSGYYDDESKVVEEKTKDKSPLKGIDRQRAMFENYFTPTKRSNTSTLGNAQKKTADDSHESNSFKEDKSPTDRSNGNNSTIGKIDSTTNEISAKESNDMSEEEQIQADQLLTDDDSDNEVSIETNHLKSLNVTSKQTDTKIE